jgi:hypothetical protein
MAEMEGDEDVPKIKLGDASCAAPFSSKLSHVAAGKYGDYCSATNIISPQSHTLSDKAVVHLSPQYKCTKFSL